MKCDELKRHYINEVMDMHNLTRGEMGYSFVYYADDVDEAIAELKARIQLDDDEMAGFLQLEEECGDLRNYIAELKAENARLKKCEIWMKQHFYCEEVIACESAKNRQLKRALWLARARSAHNAAMMWEILSDEYLTGAQFTIDFRCVGDPDVTEFQMFRGCMDWMKIYENVERKCRAKAEEYR